MPLKTHVPQYVICETIFTRTGLEANKMVYLAIVWVQHNQTIAH